MRFVRVLLAALLLAGLARPAAAFTMEQAKLPMTATLVRGDAPDCGADCPEWLALTGRIGFESPGRLAAALALLGRRRVPILLDSPGGESRAGLAMGRMIRARGLDTAVAGTVLTPCAGGDRGCEGRLRAGVHPGHVGTPRDTPYRAACASACVFVLAGGVDRSVPAGAGVGVHQAKQVLTFHPVMNMFRVLSRMVNGRKVEISRTLVSTRALPTRVVTSAAPQSLYSEFDRFLLGVGIDESIMPLMRSVPPSGILWLSQAELGSTRIATDTTDAAVLAARAAAAQAEAAAHREVRLPADLTLNDGRRWTGGVTWRIDAASPATPALVADWEVPERRLRGSVAITADPSPWSASSFHVVTRFAPQAGPDAATVWSVQAPRLCDGSQCIDEIAGKTEYGRPAAAAFAVVKPWRAFLLKDLRRRAWLRVTVRTADGLGSVDLPLASPDANAVTAWERLCCGFDATEVPLATPATALPAFPEYPEPFLVAGIRPVQPAAGAKPQARMLDLQAQFDAAPMAQHGFPAAVRGTMAWTPLAAPEARGTGTAVLRGTADLPAAALRMSVEAGTSEHGVLGRLTARIHIFADDPSRFGPVRRIVALNSYDPQDHPLLLVDGVVVDGDAAIGEIHLDIPETGPVAGAFQLGIEDAQGRRVTLAIPFDPAVAALLQGAARRGPTGDV